MGSTAVRLTNVPNSTLRQRTAELTSDTRHRVPGSPMHCLQYALERKRPLEDSTPKGQ
jgi:hypothetical protein